MIYPVYSIKDHKGTFMDLMLSIHDQAATRSFAQAINADPVKSMMAFAPGDYDLFKVAMFDSESGIVNTINPIEFIVNGSSLVGG